jgi:hypothetical protein
MSFQNHSFGIGNVYAPNDGVDHSHLWHSMAGCLSPTTWVLCKDSNMVELGTNKEGLFPFQLIAREREA